MVRATRFDRAPVMGDGAKFVHPALFYDGMDQYLTGVGGFVRAAQEAGEPVFVAVPGERLDALRDSLGSEAGGVASADMTQLGRNPGRILSALQDFANSHRGQAVRIVGEPIWAQRTPAEMREATRHEALINTAFHGRSATILCPYDVAGLPTAVIKDARRTHPTLIEDGVTGRSPAYAEPSAVCSDCDIPLPEPEQAETLTCGKGCLSLVRHFADAWMESLPVQPRRKDDLLIAISEAAANSIAHSGGDGTLRLWTEGDRLVTEVHDGGELPNPMVGRTRPTLDSATGGRGLWIIQQVCDLVEIRTGAGSLTVRMHMAGVPR
jgi:anti-sigma regulatory factor (Ser/Thr protein kinase)